jgi:DNA-binding transcriptional ArsR family regulator
MPGATWKIEDASDVATHAIRRISRQVYGNSYRLEILCRVAETDGQLFAHGLARRSGLADKTIGSELRRLRDAGLLEPVPVSDEGQKRHYYRRVEGCFWRGVLELAAEIAERADREAGAKTQLRPAS